MKTRIQNLTTALALLALLILHLTSSTALAQGTAFTYDGLIQKGAAPQSGTFNFTFALYSGATGGSPIAGPITLNNVAVKTGAFTVILDFGGAVWNGQVVWLEIGVQGNGDSGFNTLSPRQEMTPTPYAIYAESANNLTTTLSFAQLTGTIDNSQLAHSSITLNPGSGLMGGGTVSLGGNTSLGIANGGVNNSMLANPNITINTSGSLSGGGPVALGGSITLTGSGVTSLTGSDGITVSPGSGNLTLGLGNTLTLIGTSPFAIKAGGFSLAYVDNNQNYYAGLAGGSGAGGAANIAIGGNSFENNFSGSYNTAYGVNTLDNNLSGSYNSATGINSLFNNGSGSYNVANGVFTIVENNTGSYNTANGANALQQNQNGSYNVGDGANALQFDVNGAYNTAVGYSALSQLGVQVARGGSNNIAIGYNAGSAFTGNESSNIDIGNIGILGENNITRIGTPGIQTAAYIAGIITGNGSGLTSLNASQLTSGTINNSQLANSSITINTGAGLSPGGTVALGGSIMLNNTGVTSLTGGNGVTVSAATGGVTLGSTATSANTANAIVSRDGTGSFSAGSLTLAGNLNLPAPPFTVNSGANSLLQEDMAQNLYLGLGAGNLTGSGFNNTAVGNGAFTANTIGDANAAFGNGALAANTFGTANVAVGNGALVNNQAGNDNTAVGNNALASDQATSFNTAVGASALFSNGNGDDNTSVGGLSMAANTDGSRNTAIGFETLVGNTKGNDNTADGTFAMVNNVSGNENTATGVEALGLNVLGSQNTAVGYHALQIPTNGNNNVAIGYQALSQLGTGNNPGGSNNIALGYNAAVNFNANESSNIDIGNFGVTGDYAITRIGDVQTDAYIAGIIHGDGSGLINLNASQFTGTINNSQLANSSITINTGTGLSPGGTVALGGSIMFNNTGVTSLTGGDGVTVSAATGGLTLGLGSTLTLPNLPVAIVTGNGSLLYADNNQNFFTGTSSQSPGATGTGNTGVGYNALANPGSHNQNTAFGTGTLFAADGDGNTAVGFDAMRSSLGNQNTAVGSGALGNNTADGNTAYGAGTLVMNASGYYNTAEGFQALAGNMNGSSNAANGMGALRANSEGSNNTASGVFALGGNMNGHYNVADGANALAANGNGMNNTAVGSSALIKLGQNGPNRGGTNNIALGYLAGSAFTGSESSNIDIGNVGVLGENNITRIGTPGIQTAAFIAGIITGNGSGLTSINGSQITTASINNSQLANSSIIINTGDGITGAATVSLGSSVTLGLGSFITLTGPNQVGINTANGSLLFCDFNLNNYFAGFQNGSATTTGSLNTAAGDTALQHNTSGTANSAFGEGALQANTSGGGNTAVGEGALLESTTSDNSVAVGHTALFRNNAPNTTALGSQALFANTTGGSNTATGFSALADNTTAGGNTADGYEALLFNITGSANTAVGALALLSNTNGNGNVAVGYQALSANINGNGNVAVGSGALAASTSSAANAAFGAGALTADTTGFQNTAAGADALVHNTTGNANVGVGQGALDEITTGTGNTAVGYQAGSQLLNGTEMNDIDIGNGGVQGDNNITRIGDPIIQTAAYIAGKVNASSGYGCKQGVSSTTFGNVFNFWWSGSTLSAYIDVTDIGAVNLTTSDRRLKENIQPMASDALSRVMALKPSSFEYKTIPGTIFKGDGQTKEGFIADELQQIIPSAVNGEKDALTSKGTIQPQTVNLMPVVAVLTKAVQDQQKEIDELKAMVKTLSERKN